MIINKNKIAPSLILFGLFILMVLHLIGAWDELSFVFQATVVATVFLSLLLKQLVIIGKFFPMAPVLFVLIVAMLSLSSIDKNVAIFYFMLWYSLIGYWLYIKSGLSFLKKCMCWIALFSVFLGALVFIFLQEAYNETVIALLFMAMHPNFYLVLKKD